MGSLDELVSSWTESLLPEKRAPKTARTRFEAMRERRLRVKPTLPAAVDGMEVRTDLER